MTKTNDAISDYAKKLLSTQHKLIEEQGSVLLQAIRELEAERGKAFELLAEAYDEDCGLATWIGKEEFLLKVLRIEQQKGNGDYEEQIQRLQEESRYP